MGSSWKGPQVGRLKKHSPVLSKTVLDPPCPLIARTQDMFRKQHGHHDFTGNIGDIFGDGVDMWVLSDSTLMVSTE